MDEQQRKGADLRALARALLTTVLPDGTIEERVDLLRGLDTDDGRPLVLAMLDLVENWIATCMDSPELIEQSLQYICLSDDEDGRGASWPAR